MKIIPFIFVLLVQLYNAAGAESPPSFKCRVWDSPCLTAQGQQISAVVAAGIPDLDIQPLGAILIDYIHINQGGFREDLRSMTVKGMSDAVIDTVSLDMPSKLVKFVFHTDFVTRCRYISNGTMLSTPIEGDGEFFMKLENVQIAMNIPFEIIKDAHNNDIMILKSFDYTFDVRKGAQFHFTNLYNGDKQLSDNIHSMMNKKWKYLTVLFAKYLFDPVTKKVFAAFRNYMRSKPFGAFILYKSNK